MKVISPLRYTYTNPVCRIMYNEPRMYQDTIKHVCRIMQVQTTYVDLILLFYGLQLHQPEAKKLR